VVTVTMPAVLTSLIAPARIAILATILTAVLAGWNLGARSLWVDEAFTLEIAGGTWTHLWERVSTVEAAMAFYYVLLHEWLALGRDEATVRALSAVLAIATIPVAYWTGVRLVGPVAAAIGVLLLSLNAFFLRYAQEARGYALVMFLTMASSLALLRAAERPTFWRWALWVVSAALLIYSHPLAILVVGAQAVAILLRAPFRVVVAAGCAVGVLVSPLLYFILVLADAQVSWVPPIDRYMVEFGIGRLSGTQSRLGIVVYAACILAALWRGGFGIRFLLALTALPFLAILAVSLKTPLFVDRYLLMLVPPMVLLAGAGLARIPHPAVRALAVAVLLAIQVPVVREMLATPSNEEWRDAAAIIRADLRPDDATACYETRVCVCFDYYLAPPPSGPPQVPLADAVDDPAVMTAIATKHPRLWLAVSHAHLPARIEMLGRIEAMLAKSYVLADTRELTGVVLRRYERLPAGSAE
jgi:mannosyltransferase